MGLAARKSGSIVQDGVVEFIDKPTSGVLTIPNSTDEKYYINAVKEVHEKQADGSWIPFGISTNDTTTVTLDTGYSDGNFYRTRYYLGLTYSLGEITYSYPKNIKAAVDNNTNNQGVTSASLNREIQTLHDVKTDRQTSEQMEGEGLTEAFRKWNYLHNVLDFTLDSWTSGRWNGGGGTVADETSTKLWGDKSIKCSMAANNEGMHIEYAKDMSGLPDSAPFVIRIHMSAAQKAKMAADSRIRVDVLCHAKPTLTDYFRRNIDKDDFTVDGWNYFIIKEADWTEVGSPAWADVEGMQVYYNSAGSTAPTSSMDIYVQYDAIQRIRVDPDDSTQYSYFQKQIDNGVYQNVWTWAGTDEFILGEENGVVRFKSIGTTGDTDALVNNTPYSSNGDFTMCGNFVISDSDDSCVFGWVVDSTNYLRMRLDGGSMDFQYSIDGSVSENADSLSASVGDTLKVIIQKEDNIGSLVVYKNGILQDLDIATHTLAFDNVVGYLTLTIRSGKDCYIESATITSTKVADHANTADRAYRILQPSCRVYNNANISINDSTSTVLTFNSERWDNNEMHNDADTTKLRCRETGLYSIILNISFASNATGRRNVWIELNGSDIIASVEVEPSQSDTTRIIVSTQYRLEKGDYLKAKAYQSSGGALNVLYTGNYSPEFMMTKISD
jgi:hypothetical protein